LDKTVLSTLKKVDGLTFNSPYVRKTCEDTSSNKMSDIIIKITIPAATAVEHAATVAELAALNAALAALNAAHAALNAKHAATAAELAALKAANAAPKAANAAPKAAHAAPKALVIQTSKAKVGGRRRSPADMAKCFTDGQRILHKIPDKPSSWIGVYNSSTNRISYDGEFYTALSDFALRHHREYEPEYKSVNGWEYCKYEVDGKWISTKGLMLG